MNRVYEAAFSLSVADKSVIGYIGAYPVDVPKTLFPQSTHWSVDVAAGLKNNHGFH
jgi:hypothetical protein